MSFKNNIEKIAYIVKIFIGVVIIFFLVRTNLALEENKKLIINEIYYNSSKEDFFKINLQLFDFTMDKLEWKLFANNPDLDKNYWYSLKMKSYDEYATNLMIQTYRSDNNVRIMPELVPYKTYYNLLTITQSKKLLFNDPLVDIFFKLIIDDLKKNNLSLEGITIEELIVKDEFKKLISSYIDIKSDLLKPLVP